MARRPRARATCASATRSPSASAGASRPCASLRCRSSRRPKRRPRRFTRPSASKLTTRIDDFAAASPDMHKRFTIEEHVRWSDIDRAGIIYYGQFLRFFEIAETELFRAVGLPYSVVFDRLDVWLPRVQIHFDFRKPLMLDDLIEVSAFVARIGNK